MGGDAGADEGAGALGGWGGWGGAVFSRWGDGGGPASPAGLAMVDNGHAALPQLNAARGHGQRSSVDLQGMQAIADRVGVRPHHHDTYLTILPHDTAGHR